MIFMKKISNLVDEKIRIKSSNLWRVELPMKKPFTTSFAIITGRPFLVVQLISDETGYGEAAVLPEPTYTSEDVETARRMLSILLPKIVSKRRVCYNDVRETLSRYRG